MELCINQAWLILTMNEMITVKHLIIHVCGIKILRFNKTSILAKISFGVHDIQ